MVLHSGASLHGSEYSNKNEPPVHQHNHQQQPPQQPLQQPLQQPPQPPRLRNSLLRTAFTSSARPASTAYTPSTPSTPSTVSTTQSASSKRHSFSSFSSLSSFSSPSPPASVVRSNTDIGKSSTAATVTVSDGLRPARALRANPHRTASLRGVQGVQGVRGIAPPTAEPPVVRFHDPVVVDAPSLPALLPRRALSTASTPHTPTPAGLRLRLSNSQNAQDTRRRTMSEDEASVSASEASYVSEHPPSSAASSSRPGGRRHHQRTPRKSTTYLFAHPAPKLSRKKPLLNRIRPTLLMQLQKISLDARPLPVIDVYPSSLLVGNVTAPRFSKRFPRLFGINGELGLHDTILVQSDNYDDYSRPTVVGSESECDDDSSFEHRALLAVFSPLRRGDHSEIVLQDGTVWTTTALPNGSFEFTCTDEHGNPTIARWVRRLAAKRTQSAASAAADDTIISTSDPECKFIFSVIDPQSRRHPILATLTKVTLSILDRYTTVSPASGSRYPPTRAWTQSPTSHETDTSNDELSHDEDEEPAPHPHPPAPASKKMAVSMLPNAKGRTTLPVDDKLKHLIAISSVWVSLQCGWGQTTSTQTSGMPCPMANSTNSLNSTPVGSLRKKRDRQMSEPVTASENAEKNTQIAKTGRRLSARYRRSATFTSEALSTSTATADRDGPRTPLFPRKASSTGAAYVQRQKQLQQLSDTSDSERPAAASTAAAMTPRRRSRAFSRLSGEFSSMVSSKLQHHSPDEPSAAAAAAVSTRTVSNVSRSNSLRLPATTSADLKPSRNGRAVVSAYYTTQSNLQSQSQSPSPSATGGSPYTPASNIRGFESVEEGHDLSLADEQDQGQGQGQLLRLHQQLHMQHQLHQQRPPPHQDLDRGHGGKWKKMGTWLKSRLSSH